MIAILSGCLGNPPQSGILAIISGRLANPGAERWQSFQDVRINPERNDGHHFWMAGSIPTGLNHPIQRCRGDSS